jgi:hypothetical protein
MKTRRITIEEAVPGLRLAKPITGPTGIVVLGAGAELTDALIDRLRTMGVPALHVEPDASRAHVPVKTLEQLEQEVRQRFRHAGDDPTLRLIRETVLRQSRAARCGGQTG